MSDSGLKGMMKGGWHPKGKDGGKESWRGDFKGIDQVAGWMGKGKRQTEDQKSEHMSRPLATLKDPSLFGPPPKNVNYHGGAALPNEITPHRGGLGAPLRPDQLASAREPQYEEDEVAEEKPAGPPLPYRADRTGLRTDNLPPPPVHRDVQAAAQPPPPTPQRVPPPKLPSRQSTTSSPISALDIPPPAYQTVASPPPPTRTTPLLNQSSINRLGNAGVSVPAFGIGKNNETNNPWQNERSQAPTSASPPVAPRVQSPPTTTAPNTTAAVSALSRFQPSTQPPSQLSELQARFARMTSSSNTTTSPTATTPQPTDTTSPTQPQAQSQATWQQQSASLQKLHSDPQNLTAQDLRTASQTAQNVNAFRERHKETINTAGTKANELNRKFNVTGRINSFLERHESQDGQQTQQQKSDGGQVMGGGTGGGVVGGPVQNGDVSTSISRKPPPPPPPKKPASMHAPPPVPMGTKPSFS